MNDKFRHAFILKNQPKSSRSRNQNDRIRFNCFLKNKCQYLTYLTISNVQSFGGLTYYQTETVRNTFFLRRTKLFQWYEANSQVICQNTAACSGHCSIPKCI